MSLTPSTMLALGTKAPSFSLKDTHGNVVSPADFLGKPLLVVFMCNHCPYVVHLREALARFGKDVKGKGVAMVGINANDVTTHPADSPTQMAQEVKSAGYTFPYLFDSTQEVAKAYQAACTPDFFLFDKDHQLVYRGQFDNSRPGNGKPVTGKDLYAAVEHLLSGELIPEKQVPSVGCNIKWKAGNEPSYF